MFEQIIGNNENKEILKNIIKSQNIAHSYIFTGQSGIGKFIFAKEFAKAILCTSANKPCCKCKACISFENNNNPDLCIVEQDGNAIKIDQIRQITKKVFEKPIISEKKVYIINNSQTMTREAQNSFLKTLEEPPEYVVIILITKDENLFLPTIKSRCTKIKFNKLSDKEIVQILNMQGQKSIIDKNMFQMFDGSIEKALSLKDKEEIYKEAVQMINNLTTKDLLEIINIKEIIFKEKEEVQNILDYINITLLNLAKTDLINSHKYINCIKIVEDTKDRLNKNSNYDMSIDNCLITMWEEMNG